MCDITYFYRKKRVIFAYFAFFCKKETFLSFNVIFSGFRIAVFYTPFINKKCGFFEQSSIAENKNIKNLSTKNVDKLIVL